MNHSIYQFGRFHLDMAERVLLADGKAVALSPKLFDTLLALVINAGHIVEKEELLRTIWPDTFVEENSLNKNVWALRRLLGDTESFIETIPKRGYRFIAAVCDVGGERSATMLAERTRTSIIIEEEVDDEQIVAKIAVLPFRNLGADGAHLGLGLADTLITRLGNLSLIQVRPTASIVKYATLDCDALAAGRELQVDAVLDGSIRRADERVRVTVQLVSLRNESPLWAAKFDEFFTDIFAVEDTIAEKVADALLLKLTGDQRRLLTRRQTENIAAYELYLRGIHQMNQYTPDALRQATVLLNEAVLHDPNFAMAHARLGGCYNLLYIYSGGTPSAKIARLAQEAVEKTLSLDDGLSEAHAADAQVKLFCCWKPKQALAASERAVNLRPDGYFSNIARGWALAAQDRMTEAVAALSRAHQTAPDSPGINVSLGHLLAFSRRYDEAAKCYSHALSLVPHHPDAFRGLGLVNLLRGRVREVLQLMSGDILPSHRNSSPILLSLAYALSGDSASARKTLADAQIGDGHAYLRPIHLATVYAELGEPDEAFAWLERAFEEREPMMVTLNVHPFFDRIKDDPRFGEMLHRVRSGQ